MIVSPFGDDFEIISAGNTIIFNYPLSIARQRDKWQFVGGTLTVNDGKQAKQPALVWQNIQNERKKFGGYHG